MKNDEVIKTTDAQKTHSRNPFYIHATFTLPLAYVSA